MSAEFVISLDPARNLIDVRMSGFYGIDDVRRYAAAIGEATRTLGGEPGRQRMLSDITGMQIQSQEIVAAFAAFMADPRYAARRIAFVVDTSLARMQLNRAKMGRDAQAFHSRDAAEAWLFAEDRAAA